MDFTGALYVQHSGKEEKVYVCLFTCATTRAVHLEIVTDLSTDTFLLAFRRFASRKSLPHVVISDNGSTYLSAAEELQTLLSCKDLKESLGRHGVSWKFIPKRPPWYGGFWERLIGITKMSMKKVLGRVHISLLMLQTIIVEIEALLNDRPLTYVSSNIQDPEPLTPAHLLYGRRITALSYRAIEDDELGDPPFGEESDIKRRARSQALTLKHFRSRWQHEYLTSLREFHRASGNNQQKIKVGDIVLVHDDAPRMNWKLAVIEGLITSSDGLTQAANIRTATGKTNRPITRLYPMELSSSTENITSDVHNEEQSTEENSNSVRNIESSTDTAVTSAHPEVGCRPRREAARKAKKQMMEWNKVLVDPPEDVED